MPGIFITGTDTDIGKTIISSGIAGALKSLGYDIGVMKPVQSGACVKNGVLFSHDAYLMKKAVNSKDDDKLICPFIFHQPLAPLVAAKLEAKTIDIEVIKKAYIELEKLHDIVIVEGAGGIAVPLKSNFLMSDLIKYLNLPIIVIANAGLGTINHSFLTIEYAKKCGISIIGIILNKYVDGIAEKTNPEIISKLTKVPILGVIPYDKNPEKNNIALVKQHIDIDKILSKTHGL